MTVVCAPAGYGKTLAVSAWITRGKPPGPIVWSTADRSYDVRRLCMDLRGVLQVGDFAGVSHPSWDAVSGPRSEVLELDRYIEALTHLPSPVVLVLDDFHTVEDTEVLDVLSRILHHRIPCLRLVVMTRAETRLSLSRLRLSGQVSEIRDEDLTFTVEEAREMFLLGGYPVAGSEVAELLRSTQGWAVGMRLALDCSGTSCDDGARFALGHRRIAEYLHEEVLDGLSAGDRQFLLSTSVVGHVTASLARHLTGRVDSRQVIESLVSRNIMAHRSLDRPGSFEYHPLLRGLLRDELTADDPGKLHALHCSAAQWYAESDEPIIAIRHYSLACNWDAVMQVLARVALPLSFSSQSVALASALSLADTEAAQRPTVETLLAAAVCSYLRRDLESMSRHADAATRLLAGVHGDPDPAILMVIAVVRMLHARFSSPGSVSSSAIRLLELADHSPRQTIPAASAYALIASTDRAIGLFYEGRLHEAYRGLVVAEKRAGGFGLELLRRTALSYLSLIDAFAGELARARSFSGEALGMDEEAGEPGTLAAVAASALICLHSGELDQAQHRVDTVLSIARSEPDVGIRLILNLVGVGVAVTRGDTIVARRQLARLDAQMVGMEALTTFLIRCVRVAHADVSLLDGCPDVALSTLDDSGATDDFVSALEGITRAKAFLALSKPSAALETIRYLGGVAEYRVLAIETALVESVANRRLHRDATAAARFSDAVALAQPAGLIRPFVTLGAEIPNQLLRNHVTGTHRPGVTPQTSVAESTGERSSASPPQLTARELAVLQYLPTLFRAQDIADDLFVSVNTVKSHLRGIYNKLGVNNRREAVLRARDSHLL